MIDLVKSYAQLAAGLAEATAAKAAEVAQGLVTQSVEAGKTPEQMASQVALIAEDLLAQSKTNRELVVGLVRTEVERAVGRIGFVREEELAAVRMHVDRLEQQLHATVANLGQVPGAATVTDVAASVAEDVSAAATSATAVAKNAKTLAETTALRTMGLEHSAPEVTDVPAETTVVRRPEPTQEAATGKAPSPQDAPAKKAPTKKSATRKTTAKKSATKKSATKKAPVKKSATKKATAKKASATSDSTSKS